MSASTLVFVSHDQEDKPQYERVCRAIDKQKIARWDTKTMAAGLSLADQLRRAIEKCSVCVFVGTANALQSAWCMAEAGAFWGAGKRVILLVTDRALKEDSFPPQFRGGLRANTMAAAIRSIRHDEASREPIPIPADRNAKAYAGLWKCTWQYQDNGDNGEIKDEVNLTASGAVLQGAGTGSPDYGAYRMEGEANAHCAYLRYSGDAESEDLWGSIILKKNNPREAVGVWCQYLIDGGFRRGTTKWTR